MIYPVIDVTVTTNTLPDEVSVALVFGNCTKKCKGCHSEYLQTRVHKVLWQDLNVLKYKARQQVSLGATSIVLMGGTTNDVCFEHLKVLINELSEIAPVGIFSGLPYNALYTEALMELDNLTWIKVGAYIESLGGLESENTNQVLYKRARNGKWKNIKDLEEDNCCCEGGCRFA